MSWQTVNDQVKRSLERVGEPLTVALARGRLCTFGRITSFDQDVDSDESVAIQGALNLQLAWSDAEQLAEGDIVTRDELNTRHEVLVVRKLNDANGRVVLQAAA